MIIILNLFLKFINNNKHEIIKLTLENKLFLCTWCNSVIFHTDDLLVRVHIYEKGFFDISHCVGPVHDSEKSQEKIQKLEDGLWKVEIHKG